MKLIILGAPGAGKGSQATQIAAEYGIAHVSTGDVLRANIAEGTELGKNAKAFIEKGELVPDEVVVGLVANRIKEVDCKKGFLLDGFPRTIGQAKELAKLTDIDKVINLEVDFSLIQKRIGGRRMCECGATYHISTYDKETCATCGKKLYQRADDNEQTVQNRLEIYQQQSAPLVDFYKEKGLLVNVNSNNSIANTFKEIKEILK